MSEAARKQATYDDLYNIPENMTGEIIDGELFISHSGGGLITL